MLKYIGERYEDIKNLAEIITRSTKYEADDLLQETILELSKVKKETNDSIISEGKEYLFIYSIMHRQFYMRETSYYKKYKSNINHTNEFTEDLLVDKDFNIDDDDEKKIEMIKHHLEDEDWYYQRLFEMYYFPKNYWEPIEYNYKMTFRKLEELIGINFQSIRLAVKAVETRIKNKIKK